MQSVEQFKGLLGELIAEQRLAVLASHARGDPYASLIAFAVDTDLETFLFTTPRTTRKFANVSRDPRAALLIDNRRNTVADFQHAAAVTVRGRVAEVEPDRTAWFDRLYLSRHPALTDFVGAPTTARMVLRAETFYLVRHFQSVTEYHVAGDHLRDRHE